MKNKGYLNYHLIILFFILIVIIGVISSSKPLLNTIVTREVLIPGDVNGDNKISTIDYILVRKHISGSIILTEDNFVCSDIDNDNEITVKDYNNIKKIIIGLLPVPDSITKECTINYYGNGATSGSLSSHSCVRNENCIIKANTFSRTGYTFLGWTTNADGTNDGYNWTNWSGVWKYKNGEYGISNNTLNLYAMWEENKFFTINYHGNGSTSGSLSSHTCTVGENCTIKTNTFGKTGYTFLGWTTNSNGTSDGYNWTNWSGVWNYNNGEYGISNNTLNLYAMWKVIPTYTITYNANGGTGAPAAQTYQYAATGSINLSSVIPTRSGYTFLGWSLTATATTPTYSAGQAWLRSNANNYVLYAIWKEVPTYVIAEDPKLNSFGQVASCSSNTFKYRIVNINDNDFVFIWVKDAYMQLNSALAQPNGKGASSAERILANEINAYGYQNKCMVATNASFFNMSNGHINAGVVINKGKVVTNEGKVWPAFGLAKDGYFRGYYAVGLEPMQADGIRNTFVYSSTVNPNANGSVDSTNRTLICQIDKNNFAIASGSGGVSRLAYQIDRIAKVSSCYNLDGGGSRKLYYKNKSSATMTKRFGGDRSIPDMLYFVEK